ncbi:MAG: multidrug ABC transporter permease [Corynebacterium sp.]|nr:multidrug ABC transporter permease [Corynebacterium sp.]
MNPFYTIRSEWIKLSTTKALMWTTIVFEILGLLMPGLVGWSANQTEGGFVDTTLLPFSLYYLGMYAVIIQSIMVVTSEYRYNGAGVTFTATPQRILVMLSKWVLYVTISVVLTFLTLVVGFYFAKLTAGSELSAQIDVWNDESLLRMMWVYPLATMLIVTLCMGIGMLVRQTAGAIAIMLVWFVGLESGVYFFPKHGPKISEHGPFSNLRAFLTQVDLSYPSWDYVGSLYYFIAWAVGFYLLGLFSVWFRDA